MCDEIDAANDRAMMDTESCLNVARMAAARIPVGEPGECDYCGEEFSRLVGGACARCRDGFNLP